MSESKPTLRREQIAGMNIHYIMWSLDYFLDVQQRLGFESIELWCAEPHVTLDHTGYFEAEVLAKKAADRGLRYRTLCPENVVYPWQYCARKPLHEQRSLAYFKHGIELAEVLGCDRMSINSGWGDWDEDREEAWKRSREHLSILAEYAGEHGLVLTMESLRPEESNLVTTVSDAKRMIDEVASPYLQPMVDTTAMGVAGETLEDWFAAFGDGAIHEMHFIDGDPYGHLVWGDGKHDMDAFVATLNAHDLIKEAIAEKGKFDSVYWIACGGSMIDLIPAHELLQREATTFTSYIYTAREFDIMRPRRLGEKSLVIACSHSGNTPEVVEGCEIALAAGATVIAQTDNAGSKIDSGKWTTWVYPWGEGVPQAEVPAGISLSLAAELLDQQEGYADLADMYAGIAEMDKILPPARKKVNAELGDRFAKLCQEHEFFYILGSGPNFSQTYGFAICSLMEMQWQHCSYIHSAEYFHGPFEATQDGVFYFLQMGSSECRAMDERALAFLKTHTDTLMVLDAKEYGMEAVPASVRA